MGKHFGGACKLYWGGGCSTTPQALLSRCADTTGDMFDNAVLGLSVSFLVSPPMHLMSDGESMLTGVHASSVSRC
jgi:hypothetical protein